MACTFKRLALVISLCFAILAPSASYANQLNYDAKMFYRLYDDIKFYESKSPQDGIRVFLNLGEEIKSGGSLQVSYDFVIDDPRIAELLQNRVKEHKRRSPFDSSPIPFINWWTPSASNIYVTQRISPQYTNVYLATAFQMRCRSSADFSGSGLSIRNPDVVILREIPGTLDENFKPESLNSLHEMGIGVVPKRIIGMKEDALFELPVPKDCAYLHFYSQSIVIMETTTGTFSSGGPVSFMLYPYKHYLNPKITGTLDLLQVKVGAKCDQFQGLKKEIKGKTFSCERNGAKIVWVEVKKKPSKSSASKKTPKPKPTESKGSSFGCANLVGQSLSNFNVQLKSVNYGSFSMLSLVLSNPTGCNVQVQISTSFFSGTCQVSGIISLARDEEVTISFYPEATWTIPWYSVFPGLSTCGNKNRQFESGQVFINKIISSS